MEQESKTKTQRDDIPRSKDQLVSDFERSKGNFKEFHRGMSLSERVLFKGWLQGMRHNN